MSQINITDLELLEILKKRFNKNMHRHSEVSWEDIEKKVTRTDKFLQTLKYMESTFGEPDVVSLEGVGIIYCDFAKESPKGRRSLCYDQKALLSRKKFPPVNSAMNLANEMGMSLLSEDMYKKLQGIEQFDLKTSSWVLTPLKIRDNGGAIFCDNRYDHIFTYHNGADSYYSSRGFRGYFSL